MVGAFMDSEKHSERGQTSQQRYSCIVFKKLNTSERGQPLYKMAGPKSVLIKRLLCTLYMAWMNHKFPTMSQIFKLGQYHLVSITMSNLRPLVSLYSLEPVSGCLLARLLQEVVQLIRPRDEHLSRPGVLLVTGGLGP